MVATKEFFIKERLCWSDSDSIGVSMAFEFADTFCDCFAEGDSAVVNDTQ